MSAPEARRFRVAVIDDDREMRESLEHLLGKAGWRVELYARAEAALAALPDLRPDVILSDVKMPGLSGLDLLKALPAEAPPIILISAHADVPMAVQAMSDGAYTFIEKPFDPRRLLTALRHAAEKHRLGQDARRLKDRLSRVAGLDRTLLGDAPAVKALREEVVDLAEMDATVMILGETGVGKELVARALHDLGPRAGAPFIAVNCANIPAGDFEAQVFGDARGAHGLAAQADGGALFLDELGALSLEAQAKLLRFIETREYAPLGAAGPERAELRIISASNEQLSAAVDDGRFRADLYYRLSAVILTIPPLRERREDVPLLYAHFADHYARLYEIVSPEATTDDLAVMMSHEWPGNVRELRNVAERRLLAARRGRGSVAEAIKPDEDASEAPDTLRGAVAAFERRLIAAALRAHQGRMDAVAEALGIGRRTLNEKIVKLGLRKEDHL